MLGLGSGLTESQYQAMEHLAHFFRKFRHLPHPWHLRLPQASAENSATVSLKVIRLSSDVGKIYTKAIGC